MGSSGCRPRGRSVTGVLAVAALAGCTYNRADLPEPQVGGLIQVLTPRPLLVGTEGRVQVQLLVVNLGPIEGTTVSLRATLPQLPDAEPTVTPESVVIDADGLSDIAVVTSRQAGVLVINATVESWGIELAPVLLRFTDDPAQTVVTGPQRNFATGAGPTAVAVGDVNGDDLLDVVTADLNSATVSLLLGDGRGGLTLEQSLDTTFGPRDVLLVDHDRDGDTDILYVTPQSPRLGIYSQQVDGRMTRSLELSTGFPRAVAVVDFGSASAVDIVAVAANTRELLHYPASAVPFGSSYVRHDSLGVGAMALAVGDLDANGIDDVVVVNVGSSTLTLLTKSDDLDATITVATVQAPTAVAIADLDGDGALDIIVAGSGTVPELAIHFRRDGGYDLPPVRRPLCAGATSIAVGDLNLDNIADIAATCGSAGSLRIFLGAPEAAGGGNDEAYRISVDIDVGGWPMDLALADLDQDDALDIIIADFEQSGVTVLLSGSSSLGALP